MNISFANLCRIIFTTSVLFTFVLLIACSSSTSDPPPSSTQDLQIKIYLNDVLGNQFPANDSALQATVTLVQGNTVLTEQTDASGVAVFSNITGGFTVTGQFDYSLNGNTYRAAQTIHNINPPGRQLGLLVGVPDIAAFFDQPINPVVGTMISGTITNIPVIPAGYSLFLHYGQQIDGLNMSDGGQELVIGNGTAPADQPYLISSGLGVGNYKVAVVIRSTTTPLSTREFQSAAIHTALVATTGGMESSNIDIDMSDSNTLIAFQTKDVVAPNYTPVPATTDIRITNVVAYPGLGDVYFNPYEDSGSSLSLPASLSMISEEPATAIQSGYELVIETDTYGKESRVPFIASTVSEVSFDLIEPPVFTSPTDGSNLPMNSAQNINLQWSFSGSENPDFYLMAIADESGTGVAGIAGWEWRHYAPGDITSLTLPNVQLPMMGAGSSFAFFLLTEKVDTAFDYHAEFNFDGTSNSIGHEDDISSTEAGSAVSINIIP